MDMGLVVTRSTAMDVIRFTDLGAFRFMVSDATPFSALASSHSTNVTA